MYSLPKKLQQKQIKKSIKIQSPDDSVKSVKSRICCKKLGRALEDALLSIVACAPIENHTPYSQISPSTPCYGAKTEVPIPSNEIHIFIEL